MTDQDKRLDAITVAAQPPNTRVTKVIVAVHGIGDQFNYATVQTVTRRFISFLGLSTGIPLGTFHATEVGQTGALLLQSPNFPQGFDHLGFAEVYWADVPRELVKKGYTIEESKTWARTIVERFRFRCAERVLSDHEGPDDRDLLSDRESEKVKSVLQEMIETLAVLDRLCFLAEKAGLFKFDLKKILEDYLGDVQIVTEFEDSRKKILTQFDKVFETVAKNYPKAEIYIVAHSEGTVVSFLGLLTALCNHTKDPDDGSQWIEKVRGYMTIGSPIDKHLILWPGLWAQFNPANCPKRYSPTPAIEWRNFYDFGDPIGFELNTAREWLKKQGLEKAFGFRDGKDDTGFYRYWFPGKAHTDYWADEQLFGHFIETVVKEPPGKKNGKQPSFKKPPGSRFWPRLTTKAIPYFIVGALMFLAVYVLYKAMGTAGLSPSDERAIVIFRNVLGLSSVLLGVTLMARLPRLSNLKYGIPLGATGFIACAAFYDFLVPFWDPHNRFDKYADLILGGLTRQLPFPFASLIILSILVVIVVYTLNHLLPKWGLYTLLLPGFLVVAGIVIVRVKALAPDQESKPLWPVLLALAGFLYLWWLATLLLDLVLVWHMYIQNSLAMDRMRAMAGWEKKSKKPINKLKQPAAAHTPAAPTQ